MTLTVANGSSGGLSASPVAPRATVSVTYVKSSAEVTTEYDSKNRVFTEELAIADLPAIIVNLPYSEAVTLADTMIPTVGKGVPEIVNIADTFMAAVAFSRTFVDNTAATDDLSVYFDSGYTLNSRPLNSIPLN